MRTADLSSNSRLQLFALIFSLYVIGDYFTTVSVISLSPIGIGSEMNPVIAFVYSIMGEKGLLVLKIATFGAITFVLYRSTRDPEKHRLAKYTLAGLAVYSTIIVSINIYTLSNIISVL
jgi:hypothetical protein